MGARNTSANNYWVELRQLNARTKKAISKGFQFIASNRDRVDNSIIIRVEISFRVIILPEIRIKRSRCLVHWLQSTVIPANVSRKTAYLITGFVASDMPRPFVRCPRDMDVELPARQNTIRVSFPQPKSNMNWWRYLSKHRVDVIAMINVVSPGNVS